MILKSQVTGCWLVRRWFDVLVPYRGSYPGTVRRKSCGGRYRLPDRHGTSSVRMARSQDSMVARFIVFLQDQELFIVVHGKLLVFFFFCLTSKNQELTFFRQE